MEPSFPFAHDSALHLCAICGAPDVPGLACFCVSHTLDLCDALACSTCGATGSDSEATCPECRVLGRVDLSAVIPGDDFDDAPAPAPRPKSWWPTAAE